MQTILTAQARSSFVQAIVGSGFSSAPRYLAWGVGSGTASPNDLGLFGPVQSPILCTISQATTVTSGDTYRSVGTLTSNTEQSITNLGLFNSNVVPPLGTLMSQLNPGVTQVVVSGYNNFPNGSWPFKIQINSEVMTVVSGNGTNTWTVVRGTPVNTSVIPLYTQVVGPAGNMFLKSSFGKIGLSTGDQIQFIIDVQFV